MGRIIGDNGEPLVLRDSRLASSIFGLRDPAFTQVPKSKFLFYVMFYKKAASNPVSSMVQDAFGGIGTVINSIINPGQYLQNLGFVAKSIDRPKIKIATEVLNQYNKKRLIHTKHEFAPINMKFHDTVDNKIFNMFQDYYRYYFGEAWNMSSLSWANDVISKNLLPTMTGNSFGYSPPHTAPNGGAAQSTYFFDRIEIYQLFGGTYDLLTLVNPKIESFDPDDLNYEDGRGINEISMSIAYEGIILNNQGTPIPAGLGQMMGLNLSDPYDVEPVPDIGFPIFPNLASGFGTSALIGAAIGVGAGLIAGAATSLAMGGISGAFSGAGNTGIMSAPGGIDSGFGGLY